MSQLIRDWEELSKIPNESSTHILEVDVEEGNGCLIAKEGKQYDPDIEYMKQVKNLDVYLSTHTFYESEHKFGTEILKACGFDVELESCG